MERSHDRFGLSDSDWRRAELLRASLEGDDYRQDWLMQEEYAQHKRLAASLRCPPWDPGEAAWMLILFCLVVVLAVAGHLRRTGVGRTIIGVRENERGAAALTVSPAPALPAMGSGRSRVDADTVAPTPLPLCRAGLFVTVSV